jgi:hypothetical protein
MRSFVICTLNQILLGWWDQGQGATRNTHGILVRYLKGRYHLGDLGIDEQVAGCSNHSNEPLHSVQRGKFLYQLNYYQLVKKGAAHAEYREGTVIAKKLT